MAGGASWGRRFLGRQAAEMRPEYAISDHTRPNSVCTVPDYKPEKSPLSTAWNGTAGLMFEHILRSAPTPKKERRHGPRKTRRREPAGCIYSAVLQANFQRRERASARSSGKLKPFETNAKQTDGSNINAGTLNPYQPKRIITSVHISDWLNEPGKR
jgi:hypothetical protein